MIFNFSLIGVRTSVTISSADRIEALLEDNQASSTALEVRSKEPRDQLRASVAMECGIGWPVFASIPKDAISLFVKNFRRVAAAIMERA